MPSIPVDVLREILGHVRKADLATLCRVSKIFCSCSRNVLYCKIEYGDERVIQTLAQSTDLARRVRSFETERNCEELATALENMSSLRRLNLECNDANSSVLNRCTFKLDSFACSFSYTESLKIFLNRQSSLTEFTISLGYGYPPPFAAFLPNLTRVRAEPCWARRLIPGRPVTEVMIIDLEKDTIDFSIFTLSTAPIRKLHITYRLLYPTSGSHLATIFPSLEHLTVDPDGVKCDVRIPPLYLSI